MTLAQAKELVRDSWTQTPWIIWRRTTSALLRCEQSAARPVRRGDALIEIVTDLLKSAEDLIQIGRVLMDREFDSQHVLERIVERGYEYLVPKRKQTSEKAVASRMESPVVETTVNERGLHLGENEWHETHLLYLPKREFSGQIEEGHERYV